MLNAQIVIFLQKQKEFLWKHIIVGKRKYTPLIRDHSCLAPRVVSYLSQRRYKIEKCLPRIMCTSKSHLLSPEAMTYYI